MLMFKFTLNVFYLIIILNLNLNLLSFQGKYMNNENLSIRENNKETKRWSLLAPLCVISAGILWGIIGFFSNHLSDIGFSSIQITFLRCLITSVFLLIFLIIYDHHLIKIKLKDIWMFIGTGVFSIAFFNISYFTCISASTLSVACTLLYTGPCFVMIISCIIFREKFTLKKFVSLTGAVIGCAFITGFIGGAQSTHITPFAFLTGLCSGLGYGLYSIFGSVALKKYPPLTVTVYTFSIASLALLPICDIRGIISLSFKSTPFGSTLFYIVMLGIISTLLPFALYTKGLEHMETSKASMLTFIEPLCATMISIFVFHEPFGINHAVGMIAIISSVSIININFKKRNLNHKNYRD